LSSTVFERNPKKTIVSVIFIILMALDVTAEHLFDRNDVFNKLMQAINPDLAYKVQIWQHRKYNKYFHHGLEANHSFIEKWGNLEYRLTTNSLGFKDSRIKTVPLQTDKKRIVFIGDSFTEGLGLPYDETFVGLLETKMPHDRYDFLNAGVVSYSPKLYYHKINFLLEHEHLKFNELFVFIDISDIFNELEYDVFEAADVHDSHDKITPFHWLTQFLSHNSLVYNIGRYYFQQSRHVSKLKSLDFVAQHKAEANFWTLNDQIYDEWGEKGVKLAVKHMQMLVELCKKHGIKMTIAVYPWINEIIRGNRDSRQIHIWQDFAELNNIDFINYYPDFFNASLPGIQPEQITPIHIVNQYFIPGDIHWNANGHQLIARKITIK